MPTLRARKHRKFWRRTETPAPGSASVTCSASGKCVIYSYNQYTQITRDDINSTLLLYCREACSIEEADTVTITGGRFPTGKDVTRFQADGTSESLPKLNNGNGRYNHACGLFVWSDGATVSFARLPWRHLNLNLSVQKQFSIPAQLFTQQIKNLYILENITREFLHSCNNFRAVCKSIKNNI